MFLDATPQDLISFITIKEVTPIGILIAAVFLLYRYFSNEIKEIRTKLDGKDTEVKNLIEKYDKKIDDLRDKYDDELRELRKEQSGIIEKISTLISENTRVLQEVSTEIAIKRRKNEHTI